MKKTPEMPSNSQNKQWLEIAEIVTVIGSFGGSVVSLIFQNFLLASASLPLSVRTASTIMLLVL